MIEEDRVHSLAHTVVAPEGEGEVRYATGSQCPGEILLDPSHGFDEVHPEARVLLDACADGEDVGVEDYVLRGYPGAGEKAVAVLADLRLALQRDGLPLLVESHYYHGSAEGVYDPGLAYELFLAFLQGDGVHDAFALGVLQALEYGVPVRGVYHDRCPCYGGLARNVAQESAHSLRRVEHRIVHVDVDDRCAALDLSRGYGERFGVRAFGDEPRELARAGDVGAFTDIGEVAGAVYEERLQSADGQ